MTGMLKVAQFSIVALVAVCFAPNHALAWQVDADSRTFQSLHREDKALWNDARVPSVRSVALEEGPMRPVERVALLGDEYRTALQFPSTITKPEPVPFSVSTMANDVVPPFAGFPTLTPATTDTSELQVSFKENMPVKPVEPKEVESVDDCCRELTEMIAGNLESDISLESKKRMIETALKMIARNVALKAEAKITKLKADHALLTAQMQSQMGQMRSVGNAADQINRVAGPLSQLLQRNYRQAAAMNSSTHSLSQSLAQLGAMRLEEEARVARDNRPVIQLTTPPKRTFDSQERISQERIAQLTAQVEYLQQQLAAQRSASSSVQRATYRQPLQPRRQPLEPLPQRQSDYNYDNASYQFQKLPRAQQR